MAARDGTRAARTRCGLKRDQAEHAAVTSVQPTSGQLHSPEAAPSSLAHAQYRARASRRSIREEPAADLGRDL